MDFSKLDPRIVFALQRSDALGLLVWRAPEGIGLSIMRDGEALATLGLPVENAAELGLELLGLDAVAVEWVASRVPADVAVNLAAALLKPHAAAILGARAIVARAEKQRSTNTETAKTPSTSPPPPP